MERLPERLGNASTIIAFVGAFTGALVIIATGLYLAGVDTDPPPQAMTMVAEITPQAMTREAEVAVVTPTAEGEGETAPETGRTPARPITALETGRTPVRPMENELVSPPQDPPPPPAEPEGGQISALPLAEGMGTAPGSPNESPLQSPIDSLRIQIQQLAQQVDNLQATTEALSMATVDEGVGQDPFQSAPQLAEIAPLAESEASASQPAPQAAGMAPPIEIESPANQPEPPPAPPEVLSETVAESSTPQSSITILQGATIVVPLLCSALTMLGGAIGWLVSQYFKYLDHRLKKQEARLEKVGK